MADETPGQEAAGESLDAVESFIDEIVEELIDNDGEANTDLRSYDDDYLSNLNTSYNLRQAADVLHDLGEFEETDSGLWEGAGDPQEAVIIQASLTYQNAVNSYFNSDMGDVNSEVGPVALEMAEERASLESQIESFEDMPERDGAQEASLDALRIRLEAFDVNRKKRLKRLVLEAVGLKQKARGPKDWNP